MKPSGFTLFELLITLSVLSITLSIAVPQMRGVIDRSDLAATSQQFLAAVNHARSEAIKRNAFVVMRAAGNWEQGWVTFEDRNQNAEQDPGETVLLVHTKQSNLQIQGNGVMTRYIGYGGSGRSRQTSGAFLAGTLKICNKNATSKIVINAGGRARLNKEASNTCTP
ncbi:hypothetical protein PSCT_03395 [Pseudomonas sp. SCT]|jgi:type IV fimbrial biogenesis protein FimT|uniref:GspH/FimT family pseudopilin n=1 Tax=Pseudomonas sp. (strain SCT) TaxID=412955 RepID=UPI000ED5AA7D|nr:GspH/FimT family pseudopilin [Pseudomonas sp. SCT]GCA57186.1 hypothetical protein PSCT_03395 [Pseudomonas sp. SCT]